MRSLAGKIALFLFMLAAMIFSLERVSSRLSRDPLKTQYDALCRGDRKFSFIILGTSRARAGIHPKYLECFDENIYNFAIDGSVSLFYMLWYVKLFKWYCGQTPKTVLFCVDWDMFRKGGKLLEHDSEYWPAVFFLKSLQDPDLSRKLILMNRLAVIKSRRAIFSDLLSKSAPGEQDKAYKGYVPFFGQDLRSEPPAPQKPQGSDSRADPRESKGPARWSGLDSIQGQILAFEGLLDEFARDGAKVILVRIPNWHMETELYSAQAKASMEKMTNYFTRTAQERKIPFLDYDNFLDPRNTKLRHNMIYRRRLYHDPGHLNYEGSLVFTRLLWEDLSKILPKAGRGLSPGEEAAWAKNAYAFFE